MRNRAIVSYRGLPISDPESLLDEELEIGEPGPRDVLIKVEAVSVNPVDVKVRGGLGTRTEPKVLGFDGAGTVVQAGADVTTLAEGDEVWWAGDITRDGSNAEYQLVDERIVGRKPASLNWAQAAALPLTTITAWESLFDRFGLTKDSAGTLLVMAGAGGVGSIMTQLAKARTGLTVLASVSRPESREWALAMGADGVVDHRDLRASVRALAPDGVDYLFSPTSAGNIEAYADIVKPFGHITGIDEPDGLDLLPLKAKSIAWHWELMFTRSIYQTPDLIEQKRLLETVAGLVDAGQIRTTLTTTIDDFSAKGIARAHELVETGRSIGKVVVAR
jgi:NADPH2:quinone reductase